MIEEIKEVVEEKVEEVVEVKPVKSAPRKRKKVVKLEPSDVSDIFEGVRNTKFLGKTLTDTTCVTCGRQLYQVEISACKKFVGSNTHIACRSCLEQHFDWSIDQYAKLCIHFANTGCSKFCKV